MHATKGHLQHTYGCSHRDLQPSVSLPSLCQAEQLLGKCPPDRAAGKAPEPKRRQILLSSHILPTPISFLLPFWVKSLPSVHLWKKQLNICFLLLVQIFEATTLNILRDLKTRVRLLGKGIQRHSFSVSFRISFHQDVCLAWRGMVWRGVLTLPHTHHVLLAFDHSLFTLRIQWASKSFGPALASLSSSDTTMVQMSVLADAIKTIHSTGKKQMPGACRASPGVTVWFLLALLYLEPWMIKKPGVVHTLQAS